MNCDPESDISLAQIDRRRRSSPYITLALLCAAAAIAYAQRQVVAVTKESIQAELDFTKNQLGWIMSAFFAGYSLFQVPLGWLGDSYGATRVLTACMVVSALATALLPTSASVGVMVAVWAVCGIAQAGLLPIAARLVVATVPATRRAIASGLLGSSMSVGAAIMAAVGGELLGMGMRWQFIVLLSAAPGILWAILFPALMRERLGQQPAADRPAADDDLSKLLRKPALWLLCLQQFLRAAGYVFLVSWFSTFLQESGTVGIEEAGWLNGLPLLAVVVGSPIGGVLSDLILSRTGSRRLSQQALAIVCLLACTGSILAAIWVDSSLTATAWMSIGSFGAAMCGAIGYAATMHVGGARVATAFGIMNMCGNFGAALFPIVAALLRTATGDWNVVLGLLAGIYLAAAACWMLIDPS